MKIALIAAFNEESTIRRVAIETKKYVDKVIVIDDASSDNTFKEASAAGVQVIRNEKNQGLFNSLIIGSENIQKLNPDIIVTLSGNNYHNPRHIPELIEPLETRDIDISLSKKGPYDLRAFKAKAFYQVFNKNNKRDLTKSTKFSIYRIFKRLRISIFPITSRYHPYGLDKFELIEKIKKLETSEDIYFEKRDTQKELSKIESYRLICETFLKFIPPALLSLIISLAIIIPATEQVTEFNMINIIILLLSIVGLFIICWRLLILFLDKIYEKSTFIEALEDRRKEIVKIKKYTK